MTTINRLLMVLWGTPVTSPPAPRILIEQDHA